MDIKTQAAIAVAGLAFAGSFVGAIAYNLKKNKLANPLPGTTKIERLIIVKTKK